MNIEQLTALLESEKKAIEGLICEGMYGPCERRDVSEVICRTQYCEAAMNINPILCPDCAKEYNEYWDEMWADYYSGCLYYGRT